MTRSALETACVPLIEAIGKGNFKQARERLSSLPMDDKQECHQNLWLVYREAVGKANAKNIHEVRALIEDLLNLEHFPKQGEKISRISEWPVLSQTFISSHALTLVPLLHSYGWHYSKDRNFDNNATSLGKCLGMGSPWPYPELICPDLLLHEGARESFAAHFLLNLIMRPDKDDWLGHTQRLLALNHIELTKEALEEALAFGPWKAEPFNEGMPVAEEVIALLMDRGLIEAARVLALADEEATGADFKAWLSNISAEALKRDTSPNSSELARPRF